MSVGFRGLMQLSGVWLNVGTTYIPTHTAHVRVMGPLQSRDMQGPRRNAYAPGPRQEKTITGSRET